MSANSLLSLLRGLADATAALIDTGDLALATPEQCARFEAAMAAARAVLPDSATGMPGHNELLARGAEYLGDGVYAEDSLGIRLTGNAFSRENVIFLEPQVYAALRRFALEHGYEPAAHA